MGIGARINGRQIIFLLGGLYVVIAASFPLRYLMGVRSVNDVAAISVLVGFAGSTLLYGGYHLPATEIRSDLFHVVARWCLRAIGAMVVILGFVAVVAGLNDPVANVLILPALASTAGLAVGYHEARAKTRAVDAEEQQRAAEQYSQELECYKTIVETVNDGIFAVDSDDCFTLVNDAYIEMVEHDRETLLGSHVSLVLAESENTDALMETVRHDLDAGDAEGNTYDATVTTASGTSLDGEVSFAQLPGQGDSAHDCVGVVRDVTERNEREQQLEQKNARLEEFSSLLAHELRNPVTIGQIYSQQLPAEATSDAVDYIAEAFDRIENIIDIMLVLARGREVITTQTDVSLAAVAWTAWEDVDAPDATLEVSVDMTLQADETYMRHLFRNLFENAIEHGRTDVTITVGELPTGFYVADDGPGIPAEKQDTIFENGYTTAGGENGMGLGLTFVKEMGDVYGWTCAATESESGGARFEFTGVVPSQQMTA